MSSDELLKGLKILVVEDNPVNRKTLELVLQTMAGTVYSAEDGVKGLGLFDRYHIDMIFTDHSMPNMTGIELAEKIFDKDPDVPVVLVTGHNESDVVISALNAGITHFLPKPVTKKTIKRALEQSVQKVLVKKLEHESRKKDLELLRYKERYHSLQEKNAFEKQLNLIRNEFQGVFTESDGTPYFINTYYKPLDTLSGDGYSIRRLCDGSVFIFLIDSMGKGLSASITTFMSIAFINHIIDRFNERRGSGITNIINRYLEYVRKVLLDEEIVSCAFLKTDENMREFEYALFSMPSLTFNTGDELIRIKSNNPPLMTATDSFEIGTVSYENVKSVALFSDGLLENRFMDVPEHKDMMYGLIGDNCRFVNLHSFLDSTVSSYEDDITFVYINSHEEFGFDELEIKPDFKNVLEYVNGVEESLSRYGLSVSDTATVTGLMTELVMNAFEHGCLEIELEEKTAMITEGAYDEYLIKAEAPHGKKIHIKTGTFPSCGSMVFCAEITDNGKGFNFRRKRKSKKSLFGGNGIKMVSSAVDEIYFNEKGNSVRIYKILK